MIHILHLVLHVEASCHVKNSVSVRGKFYQVVSDHVHEISE